MYAFYRENVPLIIGTECDLFFFLIHKFDSFKRQVNPKEGFQHIQIAIRNLGFLKLKHIKATIRLGLMTNPTAVSEHFGVACPDGCIWPAARA